MMTMAATPLTPLPATITMLYTANTRESTAHRGGRHDCIAHSCGTQARICLQVSTWRLLLEGQLSDGRLWSIGGAGPWDRTGLYWTGLVQAGGGDECGKGWWGRQAWLTAGSGGEHEQSGYDAWRKLVVMVRLVNAGGDSTGGVGWW